MFLDPVEMLKIVQEYFDNHSPEEIHTAFLKTNPDLLQAIEEETSRRALMFEKLTRVYGEDLTKVTQRMLELFDGTWFGSGWLESRMCPPTGEALWKIVVEQKEALKILRKEFDDFIEKLTVRA